MDWLRRIVLSRLEELLGRLAWGVDFAVDEHAAGVGSTGTFEFPSDFVALARKLSPFRVFCRILLQPKVLVLIGKRA